MNLDRLYTRTTVSFQPSLPFDELIINGLEVTGPARSASAGAVVGRGSPGMMHQIVGCRFTIIETLATKNQINNAACSPFI